MNEINDQATSPWHAGERQLQERAGVAERMETYGRKVIRTYMPDQHRTFYQQLAFIVIGAVDAQGVPWASLLDGPPGFMQSPDPEHLIVHNSSDANDPLASALQPGAAVGMLGIELHTRRRNRINGRIDTTTDSGFSVTVEQAFGNCPQYIQLRQFERVARPPSSAQHMTSLDEAAEALIAGADTFFVASYVDLDNDPRQRSVDVSHRGGQPGFVQVDGNVLTIPDFAGNLHFNTLGNFVINPKAGLLFIDFNTGDVLHVSGRVELLLDEPKIRAFQGAERLWQVHVQQVVRRPAALGIRWKFEGFSPTSLLTGTWAQTDARMQADALRDTWRRLRVARIEDESLRIRSFYLEPVDDVGLALFKAGQHVPLRFSLAGQTTPVIRTYSLSSAPSDGFYRISVKREGVVSSYLHDQVRVGDLLEARAPQGHFIVVADERRPLVLLAAGVGVTPLLSMLREVIYEGKRSRRTRPTWFVQSARHLADLPFREELARLVSDAGEPIRALRLLSQPESEAIEGEDFELAGRINIDLLKAWLPFDDFDFYLCGPTSFTQGLYDSLRALHIQDERIHAETFGPSTLKRSRDLQAAAFVQPPPASESVPVLFEHSAKEARWEPGGGSLLELAESRGLTPEYSCRGGSCGTCKTRLISGQVHYPIPPPELPEAGEVLICCSVPAKGPVVLDL